MLLKVTLAFALVGIVTPDKSNLIPLEDIWALGMPGTKDIRKLDPQKEPNVKTEVSRIHEILALRDPKLAKAGPCFLVVDEGRESLSNAAKVLEGKQPISKTMPSGKSLSLFFYSQFAPGYVHLSSANYTDSGVSVSYQIVTHITAQATVHFALIPLGVLKEGRFKVDIKEVDPPKPYANQELADRAVCDPFTFFIEKEGVP